MNPRIWIRVDTEALGENYRAVQRLVGPERLVIAVVKANGYGHGVVDAARAFTAAGAQMLAVSFVEEAAALREAGVTERLLLLAPARGGDAAEAVRLGCECCVTDEQGLADLEREAQAQEKPVPLHLKVDTGMGRLGVHPDEAQVFVEQIRQRGQLKLAGVFSHCSSGWDAASVRRQLAVYKLAVAHIGDGDDRPLVHLAASAAALTVPEARLDAVRIGTLLYGQFPTGALSRQFGKQLQLRPTWKCQTRIIEVRKIAKGQSVGYGPDWRANRDSVVAVIAAGVADGLGVTRDSLERRSVRNVARMLFKGSRQLVCEVRGQKAQVVGRVATQLTSIDVTDIPNVRVGDEVTLPVARLLARDSIPRVVGPL